MLYRQRTNIELTQSSTTKKNQRPLMKYRRNDKYDVLQSIAKKPKKESGGSP